MRHTSIEDLKDDISIEMVLRELGVSSARGSWSDWEAVNCPFHDDRNASASMNCQLGLFKCHACDAPCPDTGKAGDIIDVAKYHLGTDSFTEALDWLRKEFL